ncbi:Shedu anti-phage system protein SduA domain-containing protein [Xanthomonas euvesicatoria]|uniref:Shedu anti-phage system protein SduA domain-containing protein n=1 Tax=Xanthomonas euvesicatoria TaxID=456327 RepID=UPI002B4785C0|nr:Shedu anti-phage system protein SduA domain-containing protein [Xanthomonas euvesicatoria]
MGVEPNHAIRQIQDWRAWLTRNQNYAANPVALSGLGLTDINSSVPGLIVIGRRSAELHQHRERRRQMSQDLNIEIRTYDYLVDALEGRVASIRQWRNPGGT